MPPAEPALPREKVLIVADSGRAIAQAAHRAGFAPLPMTAHGDTDLLAVSAGSVRVPRLSAGITDRELAALAAHLAPPPIPLVYGGVMEARPGLLRRMAQGREVLGTEASTLTALLDPLAFAQRLRRLRIPHPQVIRDASACGEGWLVKRAGGCGGAHVRAARPGLRVTRCDYGQRRVAGRPVSALVVGDGRRAVTLGLSGQWPLGSGALPCLFTGVVVPAMIEAPAAAALADAAARLAADIGLRGLGSVDALVDGGDWHVLEINPRLGGSLDAWWLATGADLFRLHVDACRGRLPEAPLAPRRVAGSRCVFAPQALRVPWRAGQRWPSWVADRPPPGTPIRRGAPVCAVLAEGDDRETVLGLLERRATAALALLPPAVRRAGGRSSSAPRSSSGAARASAPGTAGW